jgi:serine/threonine-protein kinase
LQTGPRRSLVWVDEQGVEDPILTPPQGFNSPRLTADARRLVVARNDEQQDIWVIDVVRGARVRLTFDAAVDGLPLWMPDGRVIFSSDRTGARNLWIATEGDATAVRLSDSPHAHNATAITPDGNRVIFTETNGSGATDVMEMELSRDRSVRALLDSAANERNAVVSPNGQWIVYESDESGRPEVFVRPYPDVRKRNWPVSTATDGGTRPLWSHAGDKLFYVSPDGALMRIDVSTEVDWSATVPVKVVKEGFLMTSDIETGRQYDVDRTGKRFLVIKRSAEDTPARPESFKIVRPWLEELKRLTPTR